MCSPRHGMSICIFYDYCLTDRWYIHVRCVLVHVLVSVYVSVMCALLCGYMCVYSFAHSSVHVGVGSMVGTLWRLLSLLLACCTGYSSWRGRPSSANGHDTIAARCLTTISCQFHKLLLKFVLLRRKWPLHILRRCKNC